MKRPKLILLFSLLFIAILVFTQAKSIDDENILSHTIDLSKQELKFYWKNEKGANITTFQNLITNAKSNSKKIVFAMNGGMFKKDFSPQGLYIENGILKTPIDTLQNGYGNFYMQPNGIFYITNNNKGFVCKTTAFKNKNIKYATQSGPLLLINGEIHSAFRNGSKNLNIRNGVGILPNGNLLFAISKKKINFYDFATFFKNKGCKNALYLDGYVSKIYLPKKNYKDVSGNFGVIIAETTGN